MVQELGLAENGGNREERVAPGVDFVDGGVVAEVFEKGFFQLIGDLVPG
jgi:hypothetical protein